MSHLKHLSHDDLEMITTKNLMNMNDSVLCRSLTNHYVCASTRSKCRLLLDMMERCLDFRCLNNTFVKNGSRNNITAK